MPVYTRRNLRRSMISVAVWNATRRRKRLLNEGDGGEGVFIPPNAIEYYYSKQLDLDAAIVEQVSKVKALATARGSSSNIEQDDGSLQTFGPNVAAFKVGEGSVIEGEATNRMLNSRLRNDGATPTSWSLSGGAVTYTNIGDYEEINFNSNTRSFLFQARSVASGETVNFSAIIRDATPNLVNHLITPIGGAGAIVTYWFNGVSIPVNSIISGSGELKVIVDAPTSTSFVSFRLGVGTTATVTGTMIASLPQTEVGRERTSTIYTDAIAATRLGTNTEADTSGWPVSDVRIGCASNNDLLDVLELTPNAVLWHSGNAKLSINAAGNALVADINGTLATIAIATPADIAQGAYWEYEAGELFASANGARGTGVASAAPVYAATLNQGSDQNVANHFAGTPIFPDLLIAGIPPNGYSAPGYFTDGYISPD